MVYDNVEQFETKLPTIIKEMRKFGVHTFSSDIAMYTGVDREVIEATLGKMAYEKKVRMMPSGWGLTI